MLCERTKTWFPLRSGCKVKAQTYCQHFQAVGVKPICHHTAFPNLCCKRLSRPPSFSRLFPGERPVPSTEDLSKGPELLRRPGPPYRGGARRGTELMVSASTEGVHTKQAQLKYWRHGGHKDTLRGRRTPTLNEAVSCLMASASSGATTALIWVESRTVPRIKRLNLRSYGEMPAYIARWFRPSAPLTSHWLVL